MCAVYRCLRHAGEVNHLGVRVDDPEFPSERFQIMFDHFAHLLRCRDLFGAKMWITSMQRGLLHIHLDGITPPSSDELHRVQREPSSCKHLGARDWTDMLTEPFHRHAPGSWSLHRSCRLDDRPANLDGLVVREMLTVVIPGKSGPLASHSQACIQSKCRCSA